jgi:hypothetical protein
MKRAGDLLAALLDETVLQKAQGYSKLFSSWNSLTENCGLAAAGAHSRIFDLERGILLVEADHPGWIQLLQTKQNEILDRVRFLNRDIEIRGISFRLFRGDDFTVPKSAAPAEKTIEENNG